MLSVPLWNVKNVNQNIIVKAGYKKLAEEKVQCYKCQESKHYFTNQEKHHRLSDDTKEISGIFSNSRTCRQVLYKGIAADSIKKGM